MFMVITYYEQKTFQVSIIGYINFGVYVKLKIDIILQDIWKCASTYINDIIYNADSLPNLL